MKKIEVLKKAIEALEGGVRYEWLDASSCNCGIVAQHAIGCDFKKLRELISGTQHKGTWSSETHRFSTCEETGLSVNTVFKALKDCGFTAKEIDELEVCSNPDILSRFDTNQGLFLENKRQIFKHENKGYLIKYLKAWVELLQEQEPAIEFKPEPVKEKVVTRYVVVDATIRKGDIVLSDN